ncbi:MAG: hypothetical protein AAF550_11950, partial [Myxococcota bacterium]
KKCHCPALLYAAWGVCAGGVETVTGLPPRMVIQMFHSDQPFDAATATPLSGLVVGFFRRGGC